MRSLCLVVTSLLGIVGCSGDATSLAAVYGGSIKLSAFDSTRAIGKWKADHLYVEISDGGRGCLVLGDDLHATLDGAAQTITSRGKRLMSGTDCCGTCENPSFSGDIAAATTGVLRIADSSANWEIRIPNLAPTRSFRIDTSDGGLHRGSPATLVWSVAGDSIDPGSSFSFVSDVDSSQGFSLNGPTMNQADGNVAVDGVRVTIKVPTSAPIGPGKLSFYGISIPIALCPPALTCSSIGPKWPPLAATVWP